MVRGTAEAEWLAQEWIAAWNRHDLNGIVSRYHTDVVCSSPLIRILGASESGSVYGKSALRDYFADVLERSPDLRFEMRGVFTSTDSVALVYDTQRGWAAVETMTFWDDAVLRSRAHYPPAVLDKLKLSGRQA